MNPFIGVESVLAGGHGRPTCMDAVFALPVAALLTRLAYRAIGGGFERPQSKKLNGYGIFALDIAIGEWDGFGNSVDYNFTSITISPEKGPYYKLGLWGDDFEEVLVGPDGSGDYLEIGYAYGLDDLGVDLSVAMTYSEDLVVGNVDDALTNESAGDFALVFGIKKTFGGE